MITLALIYFQCVLHDKIFHQLCTTDILEQPRTAHSLEPHGRRVPRSNPPACSHWVHSCSKASGHPLRQCPWIHYCGLWIHPSSREAGPTPASGPLDPPCSPWVHPTNESLDPPLQLALGFTPAAVSLDQPWSRHMLLAGLITQVLSEREIGRGEMERPCPTARCAHCAATLHCTTHPRL